MARSVIRIAFLAVVGLGTAFGGLLGAGPASAATSDCLNPHCYSLGIYAAGPHQGGHIELPLANMASGPASLTNPYHISSEMWVSMDRAGKNYIEAGVADGFQLPASWHQCSAADGCLYEDFEPGNGGSATCVSAGCGAYELFWSDTSVVGTTSYQYHHVVRFLSPNPDAKESINVFYSGGGQWTVSFTGAYVHTDTSTIESSYHQTSYVQWGGEYYGPAANGECAVPVALGADMLDAGQTLIPVEISTQRVDQQFTGKAYLSEWDWSLPGAC